MRLTALALTAWLVAACSPTGGQPAAAPPAQQASQTAPTGAPSAHSPEVQRLLAAARAAGETELNLSWAEDTLGGHEGARQLGELFNRMYGTDVKISFTPGRLDQITLRLTQEAGSGRRPFVDLFLGSETHVGPLYQQDVLEPYDYTALSPRIAPEFLAPDGVAAQVASRIGGVTYNTSLVSQAELPSRLEDVLNPKWKGLVASTQTAIGFDSVAFRPEWTPDRMRGFVRRLSEQAGGLIRGGEQERIASGEFVMLVLNTGSQEIHKLRARGAPVAQVTPDDASTINFHYLGVPRRSAHPNLAKLFVNTMLSEEGQRLVYEFAYYDLHKLPGSRTAAELADVRARGATPLEVDVQFTLGHPEIGQLRDDLFKILSEKQGS
jgi:ABC-type Fe3+ transport system substrate-binding protein